jgi:sugar phosphate isomerase/epimerase
MKLSISNIAWDTARMQEFLGVIAASGCQGLELSPSMVWKEPVKTTPQEVKDLKGLIESYHLEISSMHSLTFPHPELTFFDSEEARNKLISYIVSLGRLAGQMRIPVMVYGSARSRMIGARDRKECFKVMTDSFRQMAEGIKSYNVKLLIEPLSKAECDSLNTAEEAMELIRAVDHPNFALHIDLKSSFAEKENSWDVWKRYGSYIYHCHVANPGLKPPGPDCKEHYEAAKAIKASGYKGYISLEIGRVGDPQVARDALNFVRQVYFN